MTEEEFSCWFTCPCCHKVFYVFDQDELFDTVETQLCAEARRLYCADCGDGVCDCEEKDDS